MNLKFDEKKLWVEMNIENRINIKNLHNKDLINKDVCVAGWIKKNRKLGNLCFLTLWDNTGTIQLVDENNTNTFGISTSLTRETVVIVLGKLQIRNNPNLNISLGNLEIKITKIEIISHSKTPPLIIEDETDALEDVRLKYRFLDLRRPIMHSKLKLRFKFLQAVRNFLDSQNFIEIETPILTKPTPEGARDYVVPTRLGKNKFYALPQSPQIYKQLLMISGYERYFQIARCFRDEDLRKDRQPEHTQIDLEMSFVNQNMIQKLVEQLFAHVFKQILNIDLLLPFKKMKFCDAMELYGTDKPDIRFDVRLENVSEKFKNSFFNIFKTIANNGGRISLLHLPNFLIDKKIHKELEKLAKDNGADGLSWITYKNQKIIDGSISKFVNWEFIKNLTQLSQKGTILLVGNNYPVIVQKSLGAVRNQLNEIYKLADKNKYEFLWITDWPLYEWNEKTNSYESAHNLFTSPINTGMDFTNDDNKANILASSYDLVLNGIELGSGAMRVHDPIIQKKLMLSLGLSEKEIKSKFGFLLDSYEYGAPYHGGIGLGVDRILMIITNSLSIRDVIAFPKNAQGIDLMMHTPSSIEDEKFLDEIFVKIKNN